MSTVREGKKRKDVGDFFIVEDAALGILYPRAHLVSTDQLPVRQRVLNSTHQMIKIN